MKYRHQPSIIYQGRIIGRTKAQAHRVPALRTLRIREGAAFYLWPQWAPVRIRVPRIVYNVYAYFTR